MEWVCLQYKRQDIEFDQQVLDELLLQSTNSIFEINQNHYIKVQKKKNLY